MASSRDDFIIAIRSAFLKKSTQQKFSLLTLLLISIFVIILSNLNFQAIRYLKIGINEIVYRSSFVVSIPENFVKNTIFEIVDYTTFFNDYKKNRKELNELRSNDISSLIIKNENKELKELINDYVTSSDKILAKIIVDHESPFLKSVIINKGSKDNIKIGTNIYDQSYLVGRVIEVNYKSSRVLLLSDLNSNVPVTIAPQNIQAIITGTGNNDGIIKYIKDHSHDYVVIDNYNDKINKIYSKKETKLLSLEWGKTFNDTIKKLIPEHYYDLLHQQIVKYIQPRFMDDESVDGYTIPCCFTYKSNYKVGVKKLAKVDKKNIRLADLTPSNINKFSIK